MGKQRRRSLLSCVPCRQLKASCDRGQPCSRCVWRQRAEQCAYRAFSGDPDIRRKERLWWMKDYSESEDTALIHQRMSTGTTNSGRTGIAQPSEPESEILPTGLPFSSKRPCPKWALSSPCGTHWKPLMLKNPSLFPTASAAFDYDPKMYSIALGLEPSPTSEPLPVDLPLCDEVHDEIPVSRAQVLSLLPSQEESKVMIQNYLDTVEGTHRLFHLPSLKRELAEFWLHPARADYDWLAQYFTMLALGSRTPNEQVRTSLTKPEIYLPSPVGNFVFAARACLRKSCFAHSAKNTIIRALALMAILILASGHSCHNIDACGPWLDMAVRQCKELGHHKAYSDVPSRSYMDHFIGRRIWITISHLRLQQSMDSGCPLLLLLPSDYKDFRLENVNDEDVVDHGACHLPESMAASSSSQVNLTESTYQALLAESLYAAVDIVSRANGLGDEHRGREVKSHDAVLEYDSLFRRLLHTSDVTYKSPSSKGDFPELWRTYQHILISIFLRRLLLIVHLALPPRSLAQVMGVGISKSAINDLSCRWSLLENSLAILVAQRSMFEYVPSDGQTLHMEIYEEILKQDFFIAALIAGIQIESESQDGPSQPCSHEVVAKAQDYNDQHDQLGAFSRPTASPRQTVIQALESCRTIWGRRLQTNPGQNCSFWIYIVLGNLIDRLNERVKC